MTMALADIDGKGPLDLYVANYGIEDSHDRAQFDQFEVMTMNGQTKVAPALQDRFIFANGDLLEYGDPDLVYLNDGKGRFTPLSWTNGAFLDEDGKPLTGPPKDWGLTAAFRDLNGSGAPDIYVCNDLWTPDRSGSTTARVTFKPPHGWRCAIPVLLRWALILPTLTEMAGWISSFWTCWPGTGGCETARC